MTDDEAECPNCGRTFSTKTRMHRHAENAHGAAPSSVPWGKIAAAVALGAAVVAVAALSMNAPGSTSGAAANLERFGASDDPRLGNESAPVTVVAFESPACPACGYFHRNELPGIESRYVEPGDVRLYYAQFRAGYDFDRAGGIAQQCVARHAGDEAFFAYTKEIYDRQERGGEPQVTSSNVEEFTRDFADRHGHDPDPILSCYRNEETAGAYDADLQAGRDNGVSSTPYFFVFGEEGSATPTSAGGLEDAIESHLADGGGA